MVTFSFAFKRTPRCSLDLMYACFCKLWCFCECTILVYFSRLHLITFRFQTSQLRQAEEQVAQFLHRAEQAGQGSNAEARIKPMGASRPDGGRIFYCM